MTVNKLSEEAERNLKTALETALCPGDKITLISVSDSMAHTTKTEAVLVAITPSMFDPHYQAASHGVYRCGFMKIGRKKQSYLLTLDASTLLFKGHELAIKTDYEAKNGSFCGNACLNLSAGSLDELKEWIEKRNLNPLFTARDIVLFVKQGADVMDDGEMVWPDAPTAHAVIQRQREKAEPLEVAGKVCETVKAEVRRNVQKDGVEIRFAEKPDRGTLNRIKDAGFNWSHRQQVWYKRFSAVSWAQAHELAGLPLSPSGATVPEGPDRFDMMVEDQMAAQCGL